MSRLLNAIEERQLLGINPQDENNISEYVDYVLNDRAQQVTFEFLR